jgi:hypothetical protein
MPNQKFLFGVKGKRKEAGLELCSHLATMRGKSEAIRAIVESMKVKLT